MPVSGVSSVWFFALHYTRLYPVVVNGPGRVSSCKSHVFCRCPTVTREEVKRLSQGVWAGRAPHELCRARGRNITHRKQHNRTEPPGTATGQPPGTEGYTIHGCHVQRRKFERECGIIFFNYMQLARQTRIGIFFRFRNGYWIRCRRGQSNSGRVVVLTTAVECEARPGAQCHSPWAPRAPVCE